MKALSYRMLVIILGIAVAILVAFTTVVNSKPDPRNAGIPASGPGKAASEILKSLVHPASNRSVRSH